MNTCMDSRFFPKLEGFLAQSLRLFLGQSTSRVKAVEGHSRSGLVWLVRCQSRRGVGTRQLDSMTVEGNPCSLCQWGLGGVGLLRGSGRGWRWPLGRLDCRWSGGGWAAGDRSVAHPDLVDGQASAHASSARRPLGTAVLGRVFCGLIGE